MNRVFSAVNGVDSGTRKDYIGRMEKQFGPTTVTQADGTIVVFVPVAPFTFCVFRLDGSRLIVLEDYIEKDNK
jgi:hypothetical protein